MISDWRDWIGAGDIPLAPYPYLPKTKRTPVGGGYSYCVIM